MFCWFVFAAGFLIQKRPKSPPDKKRDPVSWIGLMLQGGGYATVWAWHRHPFSPIVSMGMSAEMFVVTITAVLSFGSVLLILAAVRTLGKEWSLTARLVEGHNL